jgi:hypothetical protein
MPTSIAIDYPADSKIFPDGDISWRLSPDFPAIPVADLQTNTFDSSGWTKRPDCMSQTVPNRTLVDDFVNITAVCNTLQALIGAMAEWEGRVPGVKFSPTTSSSALLKVELDTTTNSCSYNQHLWTGLTVYNAMGNQDPANNTLRVRKDGTCDLPGSLEHELGHTLGLWHTQGRLDRDDWLTKNAAYVTWLETQNIKPAASKFTDVGPFDFKSVMLYDSYASNGIHTYSEEPASVVNSMGTGTLVFDVSPVFNGAVYQDAAFPDRTDFFVDVEPKTSGGCFPSATSHFAVEPSSALTVARTISSLGLDPADPNLLTPSCYRIKRTGPNGTPGFQKEWLDITVHSDAAYIDSDTISPVDVSGVMWRYYQFHETATPADGGDGFGEAIAMGDFDNDGVPDLAIAVPGFLFEATSDPGAVAVFKGVYGKDDSGYIEHLPWKRLDLGGEVWSLAAGDFDGLPGDELAVGYATPDDAGEVKVFSRAAPFGFLNQTTTFSLQHWQDSTWPTSLAGSQFGYALAVGTVGGSRDALVVGAPGAEAKNYDSTKHDSSSPSTQPAGWQTDQHSGIVVVLEGDPNNVLVPNATVLDPFSDPFVRGSHDGARFGEAVAVDRVGSAILVGAPQDFRVEDMDPGFLYEFETESGATPPEVRAGAVYAFTGAFEFRRRVWTIEPGAEFGAAVAMKSDEDRYYIGVPNAYWTGQSDTIGAGRVYVYGTEMIPGTPSDESLYPTHDLTVDDFPGCGGWAGDRFGAVLRVGKLEADSPTTTAPELLAVGAPSRNLTCAGGVSFSSGWGAVYVYDDVTPLHEVVNTGPRAQAGDRFGHAIAFVEGSGYSFLVEDDPFDRCTASEFESGQYEIVVGVPGAAPGAAMTGEVHAHTPDSTGALAERRILDPDGP